MLTSCFALQLLLCEFLHKALALFGPSCVSHSKPLMYGTPPAGNRQPWHAVLPFGKHAWRAQATCRSGDCEAALCDITWSFFNCCCFAVFVRGSSELEGSELAELELGRAADPAVRQKWIPVHLPPLNNPHLQEPVHKVWLQSP